VEQRHEDLLKSQIQTQAKAENFVFEFHTPEREFGAA
jgi:hypothetical protein